jgi:diketogulonate reductase-like aldo/keto reductase
LRHSSAFFISVSDLLTSLRHCSNIGVSNYEPKDFDAFLPSAKIKPVVNQISIYPYTYEKRKEVIEYSEKHGILIEAYELSSSLLRETEKGAFSFQSSFLPSFFPTSSRSCI